jgi:hypothetical protein
MKTYSDCLAAIELAAGRKLSDDDLDDLLSAVQARERILKLQGSQDAAMKAAGEVSKSLEQAALIEKRNAAINLLKRTESVQWIQRNFGRNMAEGMEALLVGVNRAKQGARVNVMTVQKQLQMNYLGGMMTDFERIGAHKIMATGKMDRDVGRALWAIGREDSAQIHAKLPDEAVQVAKAINKWQEKARLDANEAGAWIGKTDGYITRQSHDAERIRSTGLVEWTAMARKTFDLDKMMAASGAKDADAVLKALYVNLSTGNHEKVQADIASGFKGGGNIAKKLSQERTIKFKDADAWFDYNEKFGTGNLRESVVRSLTRSADATGMMRILGTNPENTLKAIKSDLIDKLKDGSEADLVQAAKLQESKQDLWLQAVDGSMNVVGNAMGARYSANVRSWMTLTKLGGMVLSQLNDVAVYAQGVRYQGRGFFSGLNEAVTGLGRSLAPQDRRELAMNLGVVLDNMVGELGRLGSFDEPGSLNNVVRKFMKWNLSEWWTSRMRTSAVFGMSSDLAMQAGKSFDQLRPDLQRVLSLYEINPTRWDAIRASATKEVDGQQFIIPDNIADRETQDLLRTYFTDQTSYLALEPDAKTRAILLRGTQPGTVAGETARFLMQFKSFTGAYMQKVLGRELLGRGYEGDSLFKALFNGNGEFMGLAQLMVTTTLMGYASMSLKDLAKGKTPRDPTESAADFAKVFSAALVQGGGAGVYGDFLFGASSRMGSGFVETLAGPTFSEIGKLVDLAHAGREGKDVQAKAFNMAVSNSPFLNLFYIRAALNYAVIYRIQESMNPGYLRRMERAAEKENQQSFIVPPSSVG